MKSNRLLLVLASSALIAACANPSPTQLANATQPPPSPTAPIPSATSTAAPLPTTPLPTPTIAPPPLLLEFLSDVRVTSYDPMDDPSKWEFDAGTLVNGILEVEGNNQWNGLIRKGSTPEGTGVVLTFNYTRNPEFEMYFDNGEWFTDSYRRFGTYILSYPRTNLWHGPDNWANNLVGNFQPRDGTWYSILMAIGQGGEFLAVIWDPAAPDHRITYHETIGRDWAGLTWTFAIGANVGTAQFDDFMRISFTDIK